LFWAIDASQKGQPVWQSALLLDASLLAAGAVVGAVHGLWLARMAGQRLSVPAVNPVHY
jgi:hypothetical protein